MYDEPLCQLSPSAQSPKVDAVDVVHDQVRKVPRRIEVMDRWEPRVPPELSSNLCLSGKHVAVLLVPTELGSQDLQGLRDPKLRVDDRPDFPHPAAAEQGNELVSADLLEHLGLFLSHF